MIGSPPTISHPSRSRNAEVRARCLLSTFAPNNSELTSKPPKRRGQHRTPASRAMTRHPLLRDRRDVNLTEASLQSVSCCTEIDTDDELIGVQAARPARQVRGRRARTPRCVARATAVEPPVDVREPSPSAAIRNGERTGRFRIAVSSCRATPTVTAESRSRTTCVLTPHCGRAPRLRTSSTTSGSAQSPV